jgi:hypothetical protein
MRPMTHPVGHDPPAFTGELFPSTEAMGYEIIVVFQDAITEPPVTYELPDVFYRAELARFRRQARLD